MTDADLNKLAARRGWTTTATKTAFRRGYTTACNGGKRTGFNGAARELQAYGAGFDYLAQSQKPPLSMGKHVVEGVDVTLKKARGRGYEVMIPHGRGGLQTVFGETPEGALAAAGDRIKATKQEFAEPKPRDVTVDSRDAKFIPKNGAAQPPLIEEEIDPEQLLRELAKADDELAKAETAREPYDRAVKEAKATKEAVVVRLSAAGHRVGEPQLPLGKK